MIQHDEEWMAGKVWMGETSQFMELMGRLNGWDGGTDHFDKIACNNRRCANY